MPKPSYSELLKDPRWQRRRLEILQRADFKCEWCEAGDQTLHVHHRLYRKGALPWDYADDELISLCETCHGAEHLARQDLAEVLAKLDVWDIDRILGYAKSLLVNRAWEIDPDINELSSISVRNAEQVIGLADGLGLEVHDPEYLMLEQPLISMPDLLGIQVEANKRRMARRKHELSK